MDSVAVHHARIERSRNEVSRLLSKCRAPSECHLIHAAVCSQEALKYLLPDVNQEHHRVSDSSNDSDQSDLDYAAIIHARNGLPDENGVGQMGSVDPENEGSGGVNHTVSPFNLSIL